MAEGLGPIYVFHTHERERIALERDLVRLALDVKTFSSAGALALASVEEPPSLVVWDLDAGRVKGGLDRLATRFRSPVVGLTTDRERATTEQRMPTVLLPAERWRIGPVVLRLLGALAREDARPTMQLPSIPAAVGAIPAPVSTIFSRPRLAEVAVEPKAAPRRRAPEREDGAPGAHPLQSVHAAAEAITARTPKVEPPPPPPLPVARLAPAPTPPTPPTPAPPVPPPAPRAAAPVGAPPLPPPPAPVAAPKTRRPPPRAESQPQPATRRARPRNAMNARVEGSRAGIPALPPALLTLRQAALNPTPPPPAPRPTPPPAQTAAEISDLRKTGIVRVLIADDDEVLQHILAYQLAEMRWEVKRTSDGVEALSILRETALDVLLLDLNLPHKNAFEILEELNLANSGSALRIIVMSEQVQDEKIIRAFSLGAHDFVQKPLNPRVVVSRIQRLLRSE